MLASRNSIEFHRIPRPEDSEPRNYSLNELPAGEYVNTVGRVLRIRCREKEDELGSRPYIYGILEDSTFKVPFISYKPLQLFDSEVHRFQSVYSHRFEDGSCLLVATEYSKCWYADDENPDDYVWVPRIGLINRPTGYLTVSLKGIVTRISGENGLVKRCNECGRILYQERCPLDHESGWYWAVRVSAQLSDETGSIQTILNQQLACRLLDMPLSSILLMATDKGASPMENFDVEAFSVTPPKTLDIREALVEDPALFRSNKHLILTDFDRSKIYCPLSLKVNSSHIINHNKRMLDFSNKDDQWLVLKFFRKALESCIADETGLPELHGIHLLEEPLRLYSAEEAKLYLGFELRVSEDQGSILVEAYPQAYIRESVLDYVAWRREKGSSAKAVAKTLTTWRSEVLCAPNGLRGRITSVLFKDAGEILIPGQNRCLPQFWRDTYDLKVSDQERPCPVVRPHSISLELTYPPSMVFFDEHTLWLRASVKEFIEYKKHSLNGIVQSTVLKALGRLRIDDYQPTLIGEPGQRVDAKRMLLQRIRERLLGKPLRASGSIIQIRDRLYYFPNTVREGPL